jgi:4-hydroxy-tetrahydrodipicolinate synthase
MSDMVRAAIRNDWASARRINRHFYPLMQAHFWEPSPAPVKAVLAILGRGEETLRLHKVPVGKATRHKLETLVGELGLMVHAPAGQNDNLRVF